MINWIQENWVVLFCSVAGIWCVKWTFCFLFRSINGKWKWQR